MTSEEISGDVLTSGGNFGGKEKRLSLGVYPDISLKEARQRRDEIRNLLANDVDPGVHRRAAKAAMTAEVENTFEVVAREWFAKREPSWAKSHSSRLIGRLEKDVFPWIGGETIGGITPPRLLVVVQRIENRGALETAHRRSQAIRLQQHREDEVKGFWLR